MSRATYVRGGALVCCAALAIGCIELPDFARPSLVDRPRVLAIISEPPEIHPGQSLELSVLVAGADDYEISWRACGELDAFMGGSQYGDDPGDEGCGGELGVDLGTGERIHLPGELTTRLLDDLELAAVVLGGALSPETIEQIRTRVGLPFLVEATLTTNTLTTKERKLRAVKRVLISERATPHDNPPPPHFMLGEHEVLGDPSAPFVCRGRDGVPPTAAAGREVELAPVVQGDEESWIETHEVLDARGELQERRERAFYSWFSTQGEFDQQVSKSPLRNELWRTPDAAGCYPLWLVVRDGFGGSSACRVDVAIGEPDACD